MGPGFSIIFVISTVPTLLLLCLCTLLGIWLALGRTHVAIRMPIFLLGTLAIGLVFCFAARSTHFSASGRPALRSPTPLAWLWLRRSSIGRRT